ncbi:MAG TPA: hypothetical protein VLJ83_06345 [Gemmatimonadaceae bacterium]|nr:hypothetical protein [Gemmatimonadaceae bacterium]
MPADPLPVSALRPGDVLLSCGTEALSILISRLDGGDYSHSAVWDGAKAVDATINGFKRNNLEDDIREQWYLDAYRWHSPPPQSTDLGQPPYPYQPVIDRNDRIVEARTQFAYDELLMLALIVAVSKEPEDKWLRGAVRLLLSRAAEWVHEHIVARPGTSAMTCAESVAVSFDEAVPPKYTMEVDIDRSRDYSTIAAARPGTRVGLVARTFSSYDVVRKKYAELVAEVAPATVRGLRMAADAKSGVGTNLPPGCVTPRDLQTSPSLTKLGRMSPWKPPPSAASESTARLFVDAIEWYVHRPRTLAAR